MTKNVLYFNKKTYEAKSFEILLSGLQINILGTLDGYLDFCIQEPNGNCKTYSLTCDDARMLASKLLSSTDDVQQNCLFDKDTLLVK